MMAAKNRISEHISNNESMLVYDLEWQYPAITEQHAFHQCNKLLSPLKNVLYLAFPWATMIDLLMRNKSANHLLELLKDAQLKIAEGNGKYIITVCQHIHMLKFQHYFAQTGVTHVFWAHAIQGQDFFPEYENIKIYPFPLYPVQSPQGQQDLNGKRKHLFSFIGAKSNQWYLTQSRNNIIKYLSKDTRGLVIGRDKWHFNKIVYDHQINKKYNSDDNVQLIDQKASNEYIKTLRKSIFSLCPSGTGPNSIRLWESIAYGAIPVVIADNYKPPGKKKLWEEATISCSEKLYDILALPDRLKSLSRNKDLLKRKRHAMSQLWMLYGPDCFIYDIQKLFLSLANETIDENFISYIHSIKPILRIASKINKNNAVNNRIADIFILGCGSRIMANPTLFKYYFIQNEKFRHAFKLSIDACSKKYFKSFSMIIDYKKINLENIVLDKNHEKNLPIKSSI
jgi:hypothetical protein